MNSSIHPASDHRRRIPKREQILNGAREVFFALGFEGASMNEIAKAAGVSKGTLYSYFVRGHLIPQLQARPSSTA
jgi:AcrR family transcriptional regulator